MFRKLLIDSEAREKATEHGLIEANSQQKTIRKNSMR